MSEQIQKTIHCKWCYHDLQDHVRQERFSGIKKRVRTKSFCKSCKRPCLGKQFYLKLLRKFENDQTLKNVLQEEIEKLWKNHQQCEKCKVSFKVGDNIHKLHPSRYYHLKCWEELE